MSFSFGAPAAPASTGFSFGAPAAAPATTGFSFGSTTTTAAPATTGFSFGSTTTAAAPAATGTTGFSFGSTTAAAAPAASTGFSFGQPAASAAPAQPAPPQAQQPLPTGAYLPHGGYIREVQDPVIKKINEISESVNPASENCLFQFVLYNLLPPNSQFKDRLTKPPHANEEVWRRGVAENPDPDRYAPCLVVGWSDLLIRLQEQQKALSTHIATMEHLAADVTNNLLSVQHTLHQDLQKAREKQVVLNNRVLNIISRITQIVFHDVPLSDAEIEYRQRLEQLAGRLATRGGYLDKIGTLNELITLQSSLTQNNKNQKLSAQVDGLDGTGNSGDIDFEGTAATSNHNNTNNNSTKRSRQDGRDDDDNTHSTKRHQQDNTNDYYDDDVILDQNNTQSGGLYYSQYGTISSLKTDGTNGRVNIKSVINVVNDQSRMIKELVDEVSLCITDVQVCQEVLNGDNDM